jgi:hypothetical protein
LADKSLTIFSMWLRSWSACARGAVVGRVGAVSVGGVGGGRKSLFGADWVVLADEQGPRSLNRTGIQNEEGGREVTTHDGKRLDLLQRTPPPRRATT